MRELRPSVQLLEKRDQLIASTVLRLERLPYEDHAEPLPHPRTPRALHRTRGVERASWHDEGPLARALVRCVRGGAG